MSSDLSDRIAGAVAKELFDGLDGIHQKIMDHIHDVMDKRIQWAIDKWFDRHWWSVVGHDKSVRGVVKERAEVILRNRIDEKLLDQMADEVIARVGERLTQDVERRIQDGIINRAFPHHHSPSGRIRRLLQGAARTLVESERRAQQAAQKLRSE